jgi:hypothetical protein
MRTLALLSLFAVIGCTGRSELLAPAQPSKVELHNGPLTLTVTDFAAAPGVLWIAPTATGIAGAVTVRAIRYGSLCHTAVDGHADVSAGRVDLHLRYAPRADVSCPSETRALQVDATVGGLAPGSYEVHILLLTDGTEGEYEARVQTVTVG